MSEWTEATLRSAASWKAFKERKSLFETGAVMEAKAGAAGWQGVVKGGRRPLRVSVTVKSTTDLETRCPCPENQSTGALCPHAVAVGLASLAKPKPQAAPAAVARREMPGAVVEKLPVVRMAFDLMLPPNWLEAVSRGKLAATLTGNSTVEPTAGDQRLAGWLSAQGVTFKQTLHLNLEGERLAGFLESVMDHPRLFVGKERALLQVAAGGRIQITEASPVDDDIQISVDGDGWKQIGESFWSCAPGILVRLGEGRVPESVFKVIQQLSNGRLVELSKDRFFARIDVWQEWLHFPEGGLAGHAALHSGAAGNPAFAGGIVAPSGSESADSVWQCSGGASWAWNHRWAPTDDR